MRSSGSANSGAPGTFVFTSPGGYSFARMRILRCAIYAVLVGLGLLAFFLNALSQRMAGQDNAGGRLTTYGLVLLALGGIGALYEWAFWQRARKLAARQRMAQQHRFEH